ncbi:MAG TPA: sigma-70 family RNA polymerase sigma factor [Gaiellaceae bacterium]
MQIAAAARPGTSTGEHDELAARARLIEAYIPLVESLARPYARRGERLEDLVQVGSIGLIKAVDRFEPERGVELGAFAVPNILGEIKRHLRDRTGPIRVPRRHQEAGARLRAARHQLGSRLQRAPTSAELAAAAELDVRELAEAVRAEGAREPVPLEDAASAVSPDDVFRASDDRLTLSTGMRRLHRRERQALRCRFFADMSQHEIAGRLGISQTQASRLIASGLGKLRANLEGKQDFVVGPELNSEHGNSGRRRGGAARDRRTQVPSASLES